MKIENEFIPYELALELKELGFGEPCFKVYDAKGFLQEEEVMDNCEIECGVILKRFSAPLYQQAFRFFREVKLIECFIKSKYVQRENVGFYFGIDDYEKRDYYSNIYFSYKEAEIECLKKLIEIVKSKL